MIGVFDTFTAGIGPSSSHTVCPTGAVRCRIRIERGVTAAVKAIDASRLALLADGQHHVPLHNVIEAMREMGRDMKIRYRESARGGPAINVVEC